MELAPQPLSLDDRKLSEIESSFSAWLLSWASGMMDDGWCMPYIFTVWLYPSQFGMQGTEYLVNTAYRPCGESLS